MNPLKAMQGDRLYLLCRRYGVPHEGVQAVYEAARNHSCGYQIGNPLCAEPCPLCKALANFDAGRCA